MRTGDLVAQREISSLVTSGQANVPQSTIVQIPQFHPRICAVLPRSEGGFHLLPNAKRCRVRLAHGSFLKLEYNYNLRLVPGAAIAVMHNTKLRLSHKLLHLRVFSARQSSTKPRESHLAALPRRTNERICTAVGDGSQSPVRVNNCPVVTGWRGSNVSNNGHGLEQSARLLWAISAISRRSN